MKENSLKCVKGGSASDSEDEVLCKSSVLLSTEFVNLSQAAS